LDIADIKRIWLRSWLALVGKWSPGARHASVDCCCKNDSCGQKLLPFF
jgi:hypothetical protein